MISEANILQAAGAFGFTQNASVSRLGEGLINKTFLVEEDEQSIVLQQFNKIVFPYPEDIQHNYLLLGKHLQEKKFLIPSMIRSVENDYVFTDEYGEKWRALEYIENTYSPNAINYAEDAYTAARSFSNFTAALIDLDPSSLRIIITDFHDLSFRFQQFDNARINANQNRLKKSLQLLNKIQKHKAIVEVYKKFQNEKEYPTRVMHHDCKISNILFDCTTNQVVCPVDLDTVMPGKFFSDVGDMIRTMCCRVDENSIDWNLISVREEFYEAITNGYFEGIGKYLTSAEKEHFHYSGLIMVYMQAVRFITDFLNNDKYYKVNYDEHNFNRAVNQMLLLQEVEAYLIKRNLIKPDYLLC